MHRPGKFIFRHIVKSRTWLILCHQQLTRWQVIEISGIVVECGIFALSVYITLIVRMKLSSKIKVVLRFASRSLYVSLHLHQAFYSLIERRVIVFAGLRIAYLPSYIHSSNPTFDGIPTMGFALAETYASVMTATTPLLKSFFIKFLLIGAKPTVIITKQLYSSAQTGAPDSSSYGTQRKQTKKRRIPASDLERGSMPKTEEDTFSEFEPWISKSKYDSQGGKAGNTSNSDNGSDSTLHGDQANTVSSTTTKNNVPEK